MVAKGEIRRKGRVLKAAMARVQDGRPLLDCARCDGVFHTAWVIRYRNGLAAIQRLLSYSCLRRYWPAGRLDIVGWREMRPVACLGHRQRRFGRADGLDL